MRKIWKASLWILLALIGLTMYNHHPAAWPLSVVAMIMVIMSCIAELIKLEEEDERRKKALRKKTDMHRLRVQKQVCRKVA